jgi:hypothetical protein
MPNPKPLFIRVLPLPRGVTKVQLHELVAPKPLKTLVISHLFGGATTGATLFLTCPPKTGTN